MNPNPPPPRPNGWLLAFSFLVVVLCAIPPAFLLVRVAPQGWAGVLFEGPKSLFGDSPKANPAAGRIHMLDPAGPAARAGIRSADRIVAIGGHALADSAALARQAAAARPGDVVRFSVRRDSVRLDHDVILTGYWSGADDRALGLLYLVFGLAYFAIGYLVYARRPDDTRAVVFHGLTLTFAGSFVAASALTGPFFLRGLEGGLPIESTVLLTFGILLASGYVLMSLFLHFALVFPHRRPIVQSWPRLPALLHGAAPALALAMAFPVALSLMPELKARGVRLAVLGVVLAALVPLALGLRGRRLIEQPLRALASFALAWGALAIGVRLLGPVLGPAARIATIVLSVAPFVALGVMPVACGIATLVALAHSWRESDLEARQQIRWPLLAVVLNLFATAATLVVSLLSTQLLDASDSMIAQRVTEYVLLAASLLIPLAFAVAILKYRLFDLGVVVRRTATYSLATFALGAVYLAIVAGVGAALVAPLGAQAGHWPAVLGTLGVAALFVPARNWAQRLVDRSFFRMRYDAPASLGRLGRALATAPDTPMQARAAVEEVVASLRLRGAAVDVRSADGRGRKRLATLGTVPAVEDGTPAAAGTSVVPLVRNGKTFGWLSAGARMSDETFDPDDEAYLAAVGEQLALALGPAIDPGTRRELDEARRIQAALLPQTLPELPGYSIAAHWQPAREVAGDYYDVLALAGNRFALCIADVAGKGMPAALLMSNLQATVKAFAAGDPDPAELCERVNRAFAGNLAPGRFITLFYARLDVAQGRLAYTNAGHNPPLVLRAGGTATWLAEGGPLLGPFADACFVGGATELGPGDRLILYTDGVTEAQNAAGELFGEERLREALAGAMHLDAEALKDRLLAAVRAFCGDEFDDDATVLIVGVDGGAAAASLRAARYR